MTGHVTWNGNQIIDEIENRVWENMLAVARDVVQIAVTYAPKDTGRLATSIGFEADRSTFSVVFTVDAPYALFVEYGTRYMVPHPYLRPALNTVGPQYGFDFTFAFDTAPMIRQPILAYKDRFAVPSSLTEKQREHVRKHLIPTSKRHHISNVSRAHLRVRRRKRF